MENKNKEATEYEIKVKSSPTEPDFDCPPISDDEIDKYTCDYEKNLNNSDQNVIEESTSISTDHKTSQEPFDEGPDYSEEEIDRYVEDEDLREEYRKKIAAREAEEKQKYPDLEEQKKEITENLVIKFMKLAEYGDGVLYNKMFQSKYCFNNNWQSWMVFNGHRWRKDIMNEALISVQDIANLYEKTALSLNGTSKKTSTALFNKATGLRKDKGRTACLKFARSCEDPLAITGMELDRKPELLSFPNGVMDLTTGKFREGKPKDYLYKGCRTPWGGYKEPYNDLVEFLLSSLDGDEEKVAYLQRLLGYSLFGEVVEQVFPIFTGRGRNGKGVLVETLLYNLGELAAPIQSSMLLDQGVKRSAGPSPDIMALYGLRMAFASETDDNRRLSSAQVKWFTGNDTITARAPHDKEETTFNPSHTLILITNHIPYTSADDFAMWERAHIIDFPLSFVDREPANSKERYMDKNLLKKLKTQGPGIMHWLVEGCLIWQKKVIGKGVKSAIDLCPLSPLHFIQRFHHPAKAGFPLRCNRASRREKLMLKSYI